MSIISFEKKFVFIKTKKVAGTSVEALLREVTGDRDIVPAVTPRDEFYSAKNGNFSKNYLKNKDNESVYTQLVMQGEYDQAVSFLSQQRKLAYSHMDYHSVEKMLKINGYDPSDFYFFTIEGHPYSWLLSSVLYDNSEYNSKGRVSFKLDVDKINYSIEKFLDQEDVSKKVNWGKYTVADKVMVDKVVDYANLAKGLEEVFLDLGGLNVKGELPDLKKSSRHLDAFEILSERNKQKAQEVFSSLFSYMNYNR